MNNTLVQFLKAWNGLTAILYISVTPSASYLDMEVWAQDAIDNI